MRNRVLSILGMFSPEQEVYSIDECFLDLTSFRNFNLTGYGQDIHQQIRQWLGLPVCVGIGSTKTLAKLANHMAKKYPKFNSMCNLNALSLQQQEEWLKGIRVEEIWEIGRRVIPKLHAMKIETVLDLKHAPPSTLRKAFSVVMEKIIREINGMSCIELEEIRPPKK